MKHVTLVFLRRDDEILLAMKKRGFGVNKWNGAGGKVEKGETPLQAAIRETQEEINVTPHNLQKIGEIDFYMSEEPDFNHYAHIYIATVWTGTPTETEEMRPQWFKEVDIPYGSMWVDDVLWLPLLLANKPFNGSITIGPDDTVAASTITEAT